MGKKKYLHILIVTVLFLTQASMSMEAAEEGFPEISAQAACLIEVDSGRILYKKNGDESKLIASITKIMTAIIALEQADPEEVVTIPDIAEGVEGSSIYVKAGEQVKLSHLLYGLMLRSGNDAAVAIADHVGGSVDGFVYMMNQKAKSLGMENTHFANPHGLDDEEHYSSAIDMAKLTSYALQNPTFQKIVSTKVKHVNWPGEKWDRRFLNKNKMLTLYKGADGVKTGYTSKARRTLVSSATRDGMQLATVTLNDANDWEDAMNMMDWAFEHYERIKLIGMNQKITQDHGLVESDMADVALYPVRDFYYPLTEEEKGDITFNVRLKETEERQLEQRDRAGQLVIRLQDKVIGRVGLRAEKATDVFSQRGWNRYFQTFWETWFGGI